MYCLYNGEYGEHDLSNVPSLETNLRMQRENYPQYIGGVIGDFTVLNVEYDWGCRSQRATLKCNLCGEVVYKYGWKKWRSGERKTTCNCRKIREKEKKQEESEKRKQEALRIEAENKEKYIGKVFYGWEITECIKTNGCKVKCSVCGRELKEQRKLDGIINGDYSQCKHPIDYSGEEWIGKRAGNLTVIGRQGKYFITKCDCGNERIVAPSHMFHIKSITNCGKPDCPYMDKIHAGAAKAKAEGTQYENDILSRLLLKGYNAELTRDTGDYGVDIIVTEDNGEKMAIQCKNHKSICGVEVVQEVYAGGRFYDCTKFAVVSNSGYSNPAIEMAKKLGVYLSDGNFEYPKNIDRYCAKLLPVRKRNKGLEKCYEIDGEKHTLADWCIIYGKKEAAVRQALKRNISLEVALKNDIPDARKRKIFTAFGESGTITDLSKKHNISPMLVSYRMNHRGMTIEQALTEPKQNNGRPSKSKVGDAV